jgi:hypothetical protein
MVVFTKENFPTSVLIFLDLIFQQWSPVTCPLDLSTPFHRYTLCRAHTSLLPFYAEPRLSRLGLSYDGKFSSFICWISNHIIFMPSKLAALMLVIMKPLCVFVYFWSCIVSVTTMNKTTSVCSSLHTREVYFKVQHLSWPQSIRLWAQNVFQLWVHVIETSVVCLCVVWEFVSRFICFRTCPHTQPFQNISTSSGKSVNELIKKRYPKCNRHKNLIEAYHIETRVMLVFLVSLMVANILLIMLWRELTELSYYEH